jgi:predicted MFS family arabinose efflux permease
MSLRDHPLVRVFRNRDYAYYTVGNTISLVGLWVQRLAIGWLTWELTGSGAWLGAVAFADLFPALVVGPFAGVLADRFDRTRILHVTQFVSLLQAATLWLLYETGHVNIHIVFALTLGLGINAAITQPARLALIPQLVVKEDLNTALALNSVLFNSARFVGPVVAGLIMAASDLGMTFLFNALAYLAMVLTLFRVRATPPRAASAAQGSAPRSVLGDLAQGIAYSTRHEAIRALLLIVAAMAILAKPIADLLPGFAGAVFHTGQTGLVQMTSVMGAGAILGGIWLAQRARVQGLPRIAIGALAVAGVTVALFSLSPSYLLALTLLFVGSGAMSVVGTSSQTLVQQVVDEDKRGRVIALWGLIFRGAPALGVLAMGVLSEWWGMRTPVLAGALLCVACAAWALRWQRGIDAQATLRSPGT